MLLKRLELYGFKSFADKVEIEFDSGITGVVGPNGSGKSNIGDAMRWVLGEQSAKSLRGSKMEDVIFNGAQNRNPMAWCEVTLVFDNNDSTLKTEYSELSISRRFYRSGESEYYLNKQRCKRREIIDLFRDTGIGKEGYSIIGQGRIENIISSKPEGRRDIFHEAVGIMKHRTKRDESNRRLENTRGNIQRLLDKMEEMERQLKPLKRQCDNARRYITFSEQLKSLEVNAFLINYSLLNNNIKDLTQRQKELAQVESQNISHVEQTNVAISKAETSLETSLLNIENLQQTSNDIVRKIDSTKSEITLIKERINFGEQTRMRLGDEIKNASLQSERLKQEADDLETNLNAKLEGQTSRQEDIDKYKTQLEEAQTDYNKKQKALDEKKTKLIENVTALSDVKTAVGRYEAMIESLTTRKSAINNNLSALGEDNDIYTRSKKDLEQNIEIIDVALKELQEKQAIQQKEHKSLSEKLVAAQNTSRDSEISFKSIENRMNMLKNMQNDHEGYDRAVKYLLNSPDAKEFVDGIVGDIIDVPSKYTKAIDTALGRAVQNVVTNDEYDAKELIRQLRENRAGRATFLPLSAIKGRYPNNNERNVLRSKGCLGLGAELVEYDKRYEEIIYSLLGRTVICENIDVAIALAKQCKFSLRFVTLEGDVVNAGGSMSGGSQKNQSGSILSRRAEIQNLEQKIVLIKEKYENAKSQTNKFDEQLTSLKSLFDSTSREVNETNISLVRELEKMEKLNALWGKNDDSKNVHQKELEEIEASLADLTNSIFEANNSKGTMKFMQEKSQEQIQKEQSKLNELGEESDELQDVLNTLLILEAADGKELASVEREIARLRKDSESVIKNATKKHEQTLTSSDAIKIQKDLIKEHEEKVIVLEKEHEQTLELLKKANEEKELLTQKVQNVRKSHEDAREQLLSITEKKFRLETKLDHNVTELENVQNRIWDKYELTFANAKDLKNEDYDHEQAREEIEAVKRKIKNMGHVNVNALEDYTQINERYTEHKIQYDDLINAENDLLSVIDDLNLHMKKVFESEFVKLNEYFKESFVALFGGGEAKLIIHDEDNVLESGIDIVAQPPGKKLQHLSLLSGGEKALTATAILFAMLKHRPSPFCLLDEIEAALDDANLNHFADYLKDYSKNTQFVIITHRRATMESCDRLYGVTMEEKGVSKMISVKISDYE